MSIRRGIFIMFSLFSFFSLTIPTVLFLVVFLLRLVSHST